MLGWLVLPIAMLALVLGVVGSFAITRTVGAVNDRILSAASRGIADSLASDNGEITLDLSPAVFGMLENNARDNVYYSVRRGRHVLTGYVDLPQIRLDPARSEAFTFAESQYLGHDIRIVAVAQIVPQIDEPIIVQVAETLDARKRMARDLLIGLAILELALIATAAMLMPIAVRRGLAPLKRLQGEMDRRGAEDLTPLSTVGVPGELGDLVSAFNTMLARLDAGFAGIRRFTADASHQMRTPLSVLRAHVAVLKRAKPGSVEAQGSIEDIDHAGARLSHLLNQLLSLARADSADPERLIQEAVHLDRLAADVVSAHDAAARVKHVTLRLEATGVVRVRTNEALAAELLANIVDNAIRYGRPGGQVAVIVAAAPPAIRVEDDGPGIAPDDRERVFSRFIRLNPRAEGDGSGLGLSIARSIAETLGLDIRLDEFADRRGLQVTIAFPSDADSLVKGP
ncbi:MAG: sensor histidine kinase N-terminal domain-containing protein [Sphingopyxis sp.]|nr:sensor histidine kinase N-terminal domain-containing protein [Sphingopyxis sp.]